MYNWHAFPESLLPITLSRENSNFSACLAHPHLAHTNTVLPGEFIKYIAMEVSCYCQ